MKINVTAELKSLQSILKEHREKKKLVSRLKNKIDREAAKYSFLQSMLEEKGDELVPYVKTFFKSIGYRKVKEMDFERNKTGNNRAEDIGIFYDDQLIVCEITSGETNGNPPDTKCIKVAAYKSNAQSIYADKTIHGLLIINSWWKERDLSKRNKTPFSASQISTAQNMGYGLTTTKQLVNGYIKLKNKEITFDQFHDKLISKGLIVF